MHLWLEFYPLAQELPYAAGAAVKKKKKKKIRLMAKSNPIANKILKSSIRTGFDKVLVSHVGI